MPRRKQTYYLVHFFFSGLCGGIYLLRSRDVTQRELDVLREWGKDACWIKKLSGENQEFFLKFDMNIILAEDFGMASGKPATFISKSSTSLELEEPLKIDGPCEAIYICVL
jgi:hypothetical protein